MQELFRTSKWKWLVPVIFLVFFVLTVVRGEIVYALGWLGFLVGGALTASGVIERSWALSYLAGCFFLFGMLLLSTALAPDFIG
jgi:hypothetical protein